MPYSTPTTFLTYVWRCNVWLTLWYSSSVGVSLFPSPLDHSAPVVSRLCWHLHLFQFILIGCPFLCCFHQAGDKGKEGRGHTHPRLPSIGCSTHKTQGWLVQPRNISRLWVGSARCETGKQPLAIEKDVYNILFYNYRIFLCIKMIHLADNDRLFERPPFI